MGQKFSNQIQNSDKNIETKYPSLDKMFVGCYGGYVQEFSMIEKKTVHDLGKILKNDILSMAKTPDNKS